MSALHWHDWSFLLEEVYHFQVQAQQAQKEVLQLSGLSVVVSWGYIQVSLCLMLEVVVELTKECGRKPHEIFLSPTTSHTSHMPC